MALHEDDCNSNKIWPLDESNKKKININQSGFFPNKKYTLLCVEDFTVQTFNIWGASQISFPTKGV